MKIELGNSKENLRISESPERIQSIVMPAMNGVTSKAEGVSRHASAVHIKYGRSEKVSVTHHV